MDREDALVLHATAVAVDGKGVLLTGPSGAGKSGLALWLLAHGGVLVSDDRIRLERVGDRVWLSAPEEAIPAIEARGIGILAADLSPPVPLVLVVDLGRTETERMPPERTIRHLGCECPILFNFPSPYFPAGVLHYLKSGRRSDL